MTTSPSIEEARRLGIKFSRVPAPPPTPPGKTRGFTTQRDVWAALTTRSRVSTDEFDGTVLGNMMMRGMLVRIQRGIPNRQPGIYERRRDYHAHETECEIALHRLAEEVASLRERVEQLEGRR